MTIPASEIVTVNPGVVDSGGSPLALNGVILSKNLLIPTKSVRSFGSADAVGSYFGLSSDEYALAKIYFLGFDNSTIKPGVLMFAPFVDVNRAAWLQSGSLAALSLTDIQALSGTLILTVDGVVKTSSTINLASSTSFSDAATKIAAGFTGSPLTCTWNAINSTFTLTSATTGATSTITYATGTLSTGLKFTAATGAIISQGSAVDTPDVAMTSVKNQVQNWVSFTTLWEPNLATKQLFATWANSQNSRYLYVAWDTDAQAIVNGSTTNFGAVSKNLQYDGVMALYNTKETAAFTLGSIASIDFSRTNGRTTIAFKSQSGFTPTVTDQQIGANLIANGYSFYGSYSTANDQFNFLYNGQLPGKWLWLDTFVNQVYLNSQFQLALMSLLVGVKSIPYNESGYSLIRAAMIDPIREALNFGSIRVGVTLSESQRAQVNQAAGRFVSNIVEQQGYYLQVLDPGAQVRGNRGTPVVNFWYTDGGAVQKITVASIDII